jgi:hypothetical protein
MRNGGVTDKQSTLESKWRTVKAMAFKAGSPLQPVYSTKLILLLCRETSLPQMFFEFRQGWTLKSFSGRNDSTGHIANAGIVEHNEIN